MCDPGECHDPVLRVKWDSGTSVSRSSSYQLFPVTKLPSSDLQALGFLNTQLLSSVFGTLCSILLLPDCLWLVFFILLLVYEFNSHINFLCALDGSLITWCSILIKSFSLDNQGPVNLCLPPLPCFLLQLKPSSQSSLQEKPALLFISWDFPQGTANMGLQSCMWSAFYM